VPEGDTIFRTAATLHQWLAERPISAARTTAPVPIELLVGDTVTGVDARAKHVLMRFASGRVLHTHMRMTGSWHVYPAGARWRRPAWRARVVLEAGERVAVCFDAPVVELLSAGEAAAHPALAALGPDVLSPAFDPDRARARIAARGEAEIGSALLDQTALAGIGNIHKSEVLFLARVNPFRRVSSLPPARLDRIVRTAAAHMKSHVEAGRTPDGPSPLWVYRRANRPCRRCGATIRRRVQGEEARATYWCPVCQPREDAVSAPAPRRRSR